MNLTARNVLLLTMIIDDASPSNIEAAWNIFFHFYLDKGSLDLLRAHCRKLIRLSSSLEAWEDGNYSAIFRFCSRNTLSELHRHWSLYIETEDLARKEKNDLWTAFRKGMQAVKDKYGENNLVISSGASAGPLWASVFASGSKHFQRFWTTGVTFDEQTPALTLINPTFAYDSTGRGFNVHYGTDPLISFHLAMAAQLPASNHPASISDLVQLAKTQFHLWCSSFRDRITTTNNVVIRMFAGDALAFSQTLLYCARTGSTQSGAYVSPWVGTQVSLDGGHYDKASTNRAPLSFNVIETSNLTDHLGLLNILIVTVPLLERTTAAILNTNTLLRSKDTGGLAPGGLTNHACADISTLSLLLGIVPISYVSGFTSQSNIHEVALGHAERLHEPLSWKLAPVVAKSEGLDVLHQGLQFEPFVLGQILFNIYLRMFADENLKQVLSAAKIGKKMPLLHYIRGTFVALLALVKQNVRTDWNPAMRHMLDCVEADKTLMTNLNHYQDFCCQLHLHGVYTVGALRQWNCPAPGAGVFKLWKQVTPVVCVILKVPRRSLKVLEDISPNEVGTPPLHCEVISTIYQNVFSSIQCVIGETFPGTVAHQLQLREDTAPWTTDSPLIVSFYMPSWVLKAQPANTHVRFSVRAGSTCNPILHSRLGFTLEIFSARLTDTTHVRLLATRPDNCEELKRLGYNEFHNAASEPQGNLGKCSSQNRVSAIIDKQSFAALGLTARTSFHDAEGRKSLSECITSKIKIKQVSPCSMLVSFPLVDRLLTFPYPIDGTSFKPRIARKSAYIEVCASPRHSK
ncbi:hypothetical protein H0H81_000850 [Sphagnurus paluster]|uniref:DUF4470 domain-containing protein n=1 Tax=Sphagnurus paluster TaxID=117069 RepID=A0A9P7GGC4_9AGAR|nr:hypothetical protein H0H81_000850 [Sphagnurus paluster]